MPSMPITLIKGDKVGSETDYRDALPVNMYAVQRNILGAQGYLVTYPGLTQFTTGEGIDRGANYNERQENHFRVSGNQLISIDADGTTTVLGAISGTMQCRLDNFYSFNTQGVIADGKMFLYDGSTFSEVTDTDLGDPIDGVWINGYYFLTDGEYIYHTDITDETAIDPLKFATAEFMPDPSLGVAKTQDNKVMVFGRYTIEYFADIATENFAFQRIETRAQKIGIVATHAKCEQNGIFYITGGGRDESVAVYMISAGTFVKISTREIDKIIAGYTEPELSDIRMETRTENDISFVLVHLPDETLCFNITIAKNLGKEIAWSILKTGTENTPYRAINGIFDARICKWIYGDKQISIIGELDNLVTTHFDDITEWVLYSPFIHLETASVDELEIETIPGYTITDDATVAFSITNNGITYSSEWGNLCGENFDYSRRFILRRLGYVGDYVGFKFRGASKSKMAFALMKMVYS